MGWRSQHALPGPLEGGVVQGATEAAAELHHVGPGFRAGGAVEEHPLLHRGELVDVFDGGGGRCRQSHACLPLGRPAETGQEGVQLLLVEPRAGEVGGGEARAGGLRVRAQEGPQGPQEAVRQPLHRLPAVDGRAVDPAQLQAPLADVADDVQQVPARRAGVVEGPAVPPGGDEQGRASWPAWPASGLRGNWLLDAPQVVERDLRPGQGAQRPGPGPGVQVAQQPVAEPLPGDAAQLLLDRLEPARGRTAGPGVQVSSTG